MKCKKVKKRLSAFIDNEFKEDTRLEIEQHLETCSGCRQELNLLKHSWDSLELWEKREAPQNFESVFWQKLKAGEEKQASAWSLIKGFFHKPVLVPAALILVFGILFGAYLGNNLYQRDIDNPDSGIYSLQKKKVLYLDAFNNVSSKSVTGAYLRLISR